MITTYRVNSIIPRADGHVMELQVTKKPNWLTRLFGVKENQHIERYWTEGGHVWRDAESGHRIYRPFSGDLADWYEAYKYRQKLEKENNARN